jgi:hypothetical protein
MPDTKPHDLLIEHDELLARLSDVLWDKGLNNAARDVDAALERLHNFLAQPEPEGPTAAELSNLWRACSSPSVFARAVLARWDSPALKAVPVSERLPKPEDCDAKGRCWGWMNAEYGWNLYPPEHLPEWSFWLPHWALPVPTK